jgi:hypothetical protein
MLRAPIPIPPLLFTFNLSPATCLSSAVIYQFIPVAAGRVMERLIRSMGP